MPQQKIELMGWRARVRDWLAAVLQQQNRTLHRDFAEAANSLKAQFPKNIWVVLAAQLVKPLAVWMLKSAFRAAAEDLGVPISDQTVSFLADLAVDAILAS